MGGMPTTITRPPRLVVMQAVYRAPSSPATSKPTSTLAISDARGHAVVLRQVGLIGPRCQGRLHAVRLDVGGDDPAGAHGLEGADEEQADGADAEDACAHPGLEVAQVDAVEGDAERLDQRDVIALDAVGRGQQQPLRPVHQRAQAAVDGRVPAEPDVGAEVAVAGAADLAVATGVGRLDDDALAFARTRHDDAAHLVAEHQRLVHLRVADAAVLVPVEVGAAEADGGDADELLTGSGDGLRFMVDTDVVGAV